MPFLGGTDQNMESGSYCNCKSEAWKQQSAHTFPHA